MEAKKEGKPVPLRCVCGCDACVVKVRGKKMVSCPDPERCVGNLRTTWNRSEEGAIEEWNNVVTGFRYKLIPKVL